MRVLGVCGSPRQGSTEYVLKKALEFARSVGGAHAEFFSVRGKTINFCLHCDYCVRTKKGCVQKDDMVELYPMMEAADAWILATPVYQGSVSGQLKAVMDRCRAIVARNPDVLKNKVGAAIAVGGDRAGGQEPSIICIHSFFLANKMIPVSGGPFGSNLGASVWSRDEGAGGAARDRAGMRSVQRTVGRLIEMAEILKGKAV